MKEFKFREWRVNDGDVDIGSSFQPISLFNTSLLLSIKLNNLYYIYIYLWVFTWYIYEYLLVYHFICVTISFKVKLFIFSVYWTIFFPRKHNQEYHFLKPLFIFLPTRSFSKDNIVFMLRCSFYKCHTSVIFPVSHGEFKQRFMCSWNYNKFNFKIIFIIGFLFFNSTLV